MSSSCPLCVKKVLDTDEGVSCDDACNRWFHRECLKLSKAECLRLSGNNNEKWYCTRTDCTALTNQPLQLLTVQMSTVLNKLDDLLNKVSKIDEISKDIVGIKSEVTAIHNTLSNLEPRVSAVEGKIVELEDKISTSLQLNSSNAEKTIAEVNDRARRASNLMIYNLIESKDSNVENRKKHDTNTTTSFLRTFLPNFDPVALKTFRVGKVTNKTKPRPLKVVLSNESDVKLVLQNFTPEASAAMDDDFAAVKLSRDRTPREQEYFRLLKNEIHDRESGGERGNVYIPPNSPSSHYTNLCDAFEEVSAQAGSPDNVMLMGDLNLPALGAAIALVPLFIWRLHLT
ncbi:hypothetical protein J6590_083596 [Homalodisca vitripennis]|nr:hypothetical protein J6590_083596 [Homalodisca vitripennis]